MSTLETADAIVARWRSDAGDDNPAGPLFSSGPYAEVELAEPTAAAGVQTHTINRCGTACTGSLGNDCC